MQIHWVEFESNDGIIEYLFISKSDQPPEKLANGFHDPIHDAFTSHRVIASFREMAYALKVFKALAPVMNREHIFHWPPLVLE